jgi:hypothetical protein
MSDTKNEKAGPIEVWLSKNNLEVTCRMVREDETTATLDVDSLSMRGAQREITGWLISQGYTPAGRWEIEETASGIESLGTIECVRHFKAPNGAAVL